MFKSKLVKIYIILNYILKINSFQYIRTIPKKVRSISLPPSQEALFNLKNKGFTYEESLKALVLNNNNETASLIYLKKHNIT